MLAGDVVLFAAQAALRLAGTARRAAADAAFRGEIALPLPKRAEASLPVMASWFAVNGADLADRDPELAEVLAAAHAVRGKPARWPEVEARLLPLYREYYNAALVERGEPELLAELPLTKDEWLGTFRVRQLARGADREAGRRLFAHVAGTLVEIGIDYFAKGPGAVRADSRTGRALAAAANALDRIPFSEVDPSDKGWLADLAGRLTVAALETIADAPEAFARDERVRELLGVAMEGLAREVLARVEDDTFERLKAAEWAEVVFRSLLVTAGNRVLEAPDRYLGVRGEAKGALVEKAGKAVLSLVLADGGFDLGRALSREGVETVAGAVLDVLADHPELVVGDGNEGIAAILAETARALADAPIRFGPDLFPALVRTLLEATAGNIERVWPDGATDPKKHLLLTAARGVLTALARDEGEGPFRLTAVEAEGVLSSVLDALAANPAWLLEGAERIHDRLAAATAAVLEAIAGRADVRLFSRGTAAAVLTAALEAVALRRELLSDAQGKPLVAAAVDAVLAAILDPEIEAAAKWQLLRDEAVISAVSVSLAWLAAGRVDEAAVAVLKETWAKIVADVSAGEGLDFEDVARRLEAALAEGG